MTESGKEITIINTAIRVFGDPDKALRWLSKPKQSLGGATPISMLGTEHGRQGVEDMLVRIDHGMAA